VRLESLALDQLDFTQGLDAAELELRRAAWCRENLRRVP